MQTQISTQINVPIQVMMIVNTNGNFTPIWFRFKNDEEEIVKVSVSEIIRRGMCGTNMIIFSCFAELDGIKKKVQLVYRKNESTWTLTEIG